FCSGKQTRFLSGFRLDPTWTLDWSPGAGQLCCGLLLAVEGLPGDEGICLFGGDEVWFSLSSWDEPSRAPLGWTPLIPPANPLKSTPLAWSCRPGGTLEVAGLGEGGCLRWMILNFRADTIVRFYETRLSTHDGYLAATLLRPDFQAGVRKSQIEWLR